MKEYVFLSYKEQKYELLRVEKNKYQIGVT